MFVQEAPDGQGQLLGHLLFSLDLVGLASPAESTPHWVVEDHDMSEPGPTLLVEGESGPLLHGVDANVFSEETDG